MNIEQALNSLSEEKKLICPWQLAPLLDNFLRPFIHNPRKLFTPYVSQGMTVLDIGCGAGFISLGLAELVGGEGLVIAADIQTKMLSFVEERAIKLGLHDRIRIHLCEANGIGVQERVDFAVAFFMVHEVPNKCSFLREIFRLLKTSGRFFLTEPKVHVKSNDFKQTVRVAESVGFQVADKPRVRFGQTVLLVKTK